MRARFKVDSKVGELAKVGLLPLLGRHAERPYTQQNDILKHKFRQDRWATLNRENPSAFERVLRDLKEGPIIRHEAAENMGEISSMQSIPMLKEFLNDERREVRETCEIALAKVEWDNSEEGRPERRSLNRRTRGSTNIRLLLLILGLFILCRQFTCEDPAPALSSSLLRPSSRSSTSYIDADVSTLTKTLRDPSLSLFVRSWALCPWRNIGTPAAIGALSSALLSPNEISSPLFKHEVAFVFGQMSDPHSVPALLKVLEDKREEEVVRREAVDALGGIATDSFLPVLRKWAARDDAPRSVRLGKLCGGD